MQTRKHNAILEEQYKAHGECCYYCKRKIPFDRITKDHFIPRSKGKNFINNKVFACFKCNGLKGDKDIDELRKLVLAGLANILKQTVDNKWMMSQNAIDKFKWYTRILKTTGEIIDNNYKPLYLLT